MWWGGVVAGKYSSVLWLNPSFSEPVPLDCELHKYFSGFFFFFFLPLDGTVWLEQTGVGYFSFHIWKVKSRLILGISLLPNQLGSDRTLADEAIIINNSFLLRASFVTDCSGYFKIVSFPLLLQDNKKKNFSNIYCENLVKLLDIHHMKQWGFLMTGCLWSF